MCRRTNNIIISYKKRFHINQTTELKRSEMKIEDIVFNPNCCIDSGILELSRYEMLKSIEIGDDCFESVKTFKMDGLNRLKSLKIGKNSFTEKRNDFGKNESKSFHILNCKSLESIEIGDYSFSDFEYGLNIFLYSNFASFNSNNSIFLFHYVTSVIHMSIILIYVLRLE